MSKQLLQRPYSWHPTARDLAEQDICNRILADPAWTAWCDDYTPDEWNDYIALLLHVQGLGSPTDWSDYRTRWRQAQQTKTKDKAQARMAGHAARDGHPVRFAQTLGIAPQP